MSDFYDEVNQLINDIVGNKIKHQESAIRIKKMKEKYGDDVFPELFFEPEPKPWNRDYFTKLKKMSVTGACSEQFILHMSEVSDFVYKKTKKKLLSALIIGVVAILIIIWTILEKK